MMQCDCAGTQKFRHYIYGISEDLEEHFLTTVLSEEGAIEWADKHAEAFRGRFPRYSIRLVDKEVVSIIR